jgi:hypothetical protein
MLIDVARERPRCSAQIRADTCGRLAGHRGQHLSEDECTRRLGYIDVWSTYNSTHKRHRRTLAPLTSCSMPDDTCSGRLEVALRHDAPIERLLGTTDDRRRFFSLDVADYLVLCANHHRRYDTEMRMKAVSR